MGQGRVGVERRKGTSEKSLGRDGIRNAQYILKVAKRTYGEEIF